MTKSSRATDEAKKWSEIAKWREAHPTFEMTDEALLTIGSFPSLRLMDYMVAKEAIGDDPDLARFLRDLYQEMTWVYGNWQKALRDSNADKLIADLMNNAAYGPEYGLTRKFIQDYADANNLSLDA